jgi:hypothetical protein
MAFFLAEIAAYTNLQWEKSWDNSPRPRHAKWLLKHAKNGENFHSTPLRPCRMSPALVYRG